MYKAEIKKTLSRAADTNNGFQQRTADISEHYNYFILYNILLMGRLIYDCCNLQNNLGKVSGVTKAKIYVTEGLVLVNSPKINKVLSCVRKFCTVAKKIWGIS